jgi:hypothetical protein
MSPCECSWAGPGRCECNLQPACSHNHTLKARDLPDLFRGSPAGLPGRCHRLAGRRIRRSTPGRDGGGLLAGHDRQGELLMTDGLHGYAQDPPKPDLEEVPGEPGQQGVPVRQHE